MGSRSLTFYIGVTGNVRKRVWQHKRGEIEGFTKKYKCDRLLYHEEWVYFDRAEARETELKKWRREKKIALIKTMNPTFQDLAEHWYDDLPPELQIPRRSAPRNDNSMSRSAVKKKGAAGGKR
jgi:putative endonuclease